MTDVHCIIEAMIGADSGVQLLHPVADGVPDLVRLHVHLLAKGPVTAEDMRLHSVEVLNLVND